jgi:hypothetical protein
MQMILPRELRYRLQGLPESGMGYQRVIVVLNNGETHDGIVMSGEYLNTNDDSQFSESDIKDIRVI